MRRASLVLLEREDRHEEVQSSLFRGSGSNVTSSSKIRKYTAIMKRNGWGSFPPIHGHVGVFDASDLEDYQEAEEDGYDHELDYSRALTRRDVGKKIAYIEDGHHRAYAAKAARIPLRIKLW